MGRSLNFPIHILLHGDRIKGKVSKWVTPAYRQNVSGHSGEGIDGWFVTSRKDDNRSVTRNSWMTLSVRGRELARKELASSWILPGVTPFQLSVDIGSMLEGWRLLLESGKAEFVFRAAQRRAAAEGSDDEIPLGFE